MRSRTPASMSTAVMNLDRLRAELGVATKATHFVKKLTPGQIEAALRVAQQLDSIARSKEAT